MLVRIQRKVSLLNFDRLYFMPVIRRALGVNVALITGACVCTVVTVDESLHGLYDPPAR